MFGMLYPGEIYTVEDYDKATNTYTFWGKGYRFRVYQETIAAGKVRIIDEKNEDCKCYEPNKYGHYQWCSQYGK
jgi:hypothetical protein